jgi:ribosomal protein S6--L-glutamate ligase
MIIKSIRELHARYDQLSSGDVVVGSVSLKHFKNMVLIDLLERGINCLPSALSQVLNSSKVAQAFIYKDWMIPHTLAIHRRVDLLDAIAGYARQGIASVVTKQDHKHCGHGVRRWENMESVYNILGFSETAYPFVIQPWIEPVNDVRVIIIGDYIEAYIRRNPYNFRKNLSAGGQSHPFRLDPQGRKFCSSAMARGKFPYAHIDLLITQSGEYYLSEIALNGGIRGADISRQDLKRMKRDLLGTLARKAEQGGCAGKN